MSKNLTLLLLLLGFLLSIGCNSIPKAKEIEKSGMENEGYTEKMGHVVLEGTIYNTKGAQPVLAGVILSSGALKKEFGENWRPKIDSLMQHKIKIHGTQERYYCGPMEQCLSEGYIDFLVQIEHIIIQ